MRGHREGQGRLAIESTQPVDLVVAGALDPADDPRRGSRRGSMPPRPICAWAMPLSVPYGVPYCWYGRPVDITSSGYPFHSPNSGRLADILGVMMEW